MFFVLFLITNIRVDEGLQDIENLLEIVVHSED